MKVYLAFLMTKDVPDTIVDAPVSTTKHTSNFRKLKQSVLAFGSLNQLHQSRKICEAHLRWASYIFLHCCKWLIHVLWPTVLIFWIFCGANRSWKRHERDFVNLQYCQSLRRKLNNSVRFKGHEAFQVMSILASITSTLCLLTTWPSSFTLSFSKSRLDVFNLRLCAVKRVLTFSVCFSRSSRNFKNIITSSWWTLT